MKDEKKGRGPRKPKVEKVNGTSVETPSMIDVLTSEKVALENKLTSIEKMNATLNDKLTSYTKECTSAISESKRYKDAYTLLLNKFNDLESKFDKVPSWVKHVFNAK